MQNNVKKEDYKTAAEYLKKGPENESTLSYLMLSYEFLKDYESAVKCARKILKITLKNNSLLKRLVDYHFELENYDKCLYYINKADYGDPYKKTLILYRLERYEECIEECRKIKTAESYLLTGRSYRKLENTSKAVRYLFKAYESDYNPDTLFEISEIYFEAEDYSRSIYFLKEVLIHDESNVEAHNRIAAAYLNSSNWYGAIEYGEKTLKINPKVPDAYLTLAEAYFQLEVSFEKPLEILDEGLRENPDSAELWARKGGLSFPHDIFAFHQSYEKAISLNPHDGKVYRKYIYLLLLNDEDETAKKFYNEMLLYNPLFEKSFDELKKSMYL